MSRLWQTLAIVLALMVVTTPQYTTRWWVGFLAMGAALFQLWLTAKREGGS